VRWILALALALAAGLGALYGLTGGFTVLTAEAARRQDVARHPRAIPAAEVLTGDGRVLDLDRELRRDGRVALVNFFYTRCLALCLAQGSLTERLQQAIEARGLQDRIRLISISFDPRDRAPDLACPSPAPRSAMPCWRCSASRSCRRPWASSSTMPPSTS
jgi:protein SCO1/2